MHLTVGKRGRVNGQVHASYITVLGQVFGEIRSDGIVSLAKGANVEGGIFCARVLIEDGARFKGQIQMGESPDITVSNDPARGKSVRSGKTSIIAA
jgi:cytoskeletal protein CcmA (bactofilin family)